MCGPACPLLHLAQVRVLIKKSAFHNVAFLISRICEAVVSCERYARGRDVTLETRLTDPRNLKTV